MPALLLLALALASSACQTVNGQRRLVGRRAVAPSGCTESSIAAVVDPRTRDRVRLELNSTQTCACHDVIYAQEQHRELNNGWKVGLSAATGLSAMVGLTVVVGPALDPFDAAPRPRQTGESDLMRLAAGWGLVILPSVVIAAVTGLAVNKVVVPLRPLEEVEPERAPSEWAARGVVRGPGLPEGGLRLVAGALELTLQQAGTVDFSRLSLEGTPVELSREGLEQLKFLPICAQAIRGFDPEAALPPRSVLEPRWQRGLACQRNGWGFADLLLAQLSPTFTSTIPYAAEWSRSALEADLPR